MIEAHLIAVARGEVTSHTLPDGTKASRFRAFVKGMTDSNNHLIFCEAFGKDSATLTKALGEYDGLYIRGDLSIRPYRNRAGRFQVPIVVKIREFKFLGAIRDTATHLWVSAKGNLRADPDAKQTPKGLAVTNFDIAVNERKLDAEGTAQKVTTWLAVTTWNGRAEACAKHLTKGSKVEVRGSHVGVELWKTKTGEDRASLTITAKVVEFLNRAAGTNAENGRTLEEMPLEQEAA